MGTPRFLTIERHVAVHEVGHLTVGLHVGIDEQGIVFRPDRHDQTAQAWYRGVTPQQLISRSLAGILAHLIILPQTLEPHLRESYQHSVIFTPDHPFFNRLTPAERGFISGAGTDLEIAYSASMGIFPTSPGSVIKLLREVEQQTRSIIVQQRQSILRIVDDIYAWASEDDRRDDVMFLYPVQRASSLIRRN